MKTAIAAITMGITSLVSSAAMAGPIFHARVVVRPPVVAVQAPPQTTYVAPTYVAPAPTYVAPAQPVYVAPAPAPTYVAPGYGYGGGAWQNPQTFGARVRARMDAVESEVRAGVQRGRVMPQALQAVANHRARVEQALAQVSADGVVAMGERREVNDMVERMNGIDEQFRVRAGFRAGYGAGYRGGNGEGMGWRDGNGEGTGWRGGR